MYNGENLFVHMFNQINRLIHRPKTFRALFDHIKTSALQKYVCDQQRVMQLRSFEAKHVMPEQAMNV